MDSASQGLRLGTESPQRAQHGSLAGGGVEEGVSGPQNVVFGQFVGCFWMFLVTHFFPPTCQVRVSRFYVSWPAASSASCSSTSSSAGPQLQAQDQSVPRRTSTASSGAKWSCRTERMPQQNVRENAS